MAETVANSANAFFVREVHRALRHLYDPAELCRSPLVDILDFNQHESPASALRRCLTDAVAAMKPGRDVPLQSKAWRFYRLLFHRYVEQLSQQEVATDLGLGTRQLRREEIEALQVLGDHLWARYGLQYKTSARQAAAASSAEENSGGDEGQAAREQELDWLHKSLPSEPTEVAPAVQEALRIVGPLLRRLRVRVACSVPQGLQRAAAQPEALCHALANVLTAAVRSAPGGQVTVGAQARGRELSIHIQAESGRHRATELWPNDAACLDMARQLLQLFGGSLRVAASGEGQGFAATLTLSAVDRVAVLLIDDNADTLHLFQRYLAGSRYPFIGVRDPEQALALATEVLPQAILLDIMLPRVNGWELLGRLREHPKTNGVPVVVCSILPQEQLALAFGAAAFLRKPVSRADLLATLDRLVG